MFGFLKKTLSNIYNQFSSKLFSLFNRSTIDQSTLDELEKILISADTGVYTARKIIQALKSQMQSGQIHKGADLHKALAEQLKLLITSKPYDSDADVYLLVGINGSGKTTFASKLATMLQKNNKKVLFVAGDTFRAAATAQLKSWGDKLNIPVIIGKENQDPASVVFAGCQEYLDNNYDCLIIDTAGRLQTKSHLMKELEKIKRIISTKLPNKKISTILTIDSMLGQNSFDQAKIFNESTQVNGIVITKMDGTAKGGIVFAINQELGIPIGFVSFGEQPDQMSLFNADSFIDQLLTQE